jgi:pimeloyl-ACP methyl ester carboxylesterase
MAGRVLLIGWGNARRSQLRPYEQMYAALGLEASAIIPSAAAGLLRPDAYAHSVEAAAAALTAEPEGGPTVVHLFSDNGFIAWSALLRALAGTAQGRRARDGICGVIYDSSPGLWAVRGPVDFAKRFALGMTPMVSQAAGLGARERLPVVTPLLAAGFLAYQAFFRGAVRSMLAASGHVTREQPHCRHLFLLGEADRLVPARDVRAWIERERGLGIETSELSFPEGRHVALYASDPNRYTGAVTAFVHSVMPTQVDTRGCERR